VKSLDIGTISLVLSLVGLTIAVISAIIASYAAIQIIGLKNSTHQIEYVDPEIEKANKEFIDEWATSQESITKQEKMFGEDLKDTMPEFAAEDEDKEIFSF
jgi:hypothetical protein